MQLKDNIENQKTINDLKNKPKIFLNFREGMTKSEYQNELKTLVESGKLYLGDDYLNYHYNIGNCTSPIIKPIFDNNNNLIKIRLSGGQCMYNLYKEKYNLPSLIERKYNSVSYDTNGVPVISGITQTEMILPQKSLTEYEDGEIITKGNIVLRFENNMRRISRESAIENRYYNLYNGNYSGVGGSLGDIEITYSTKSQFLKDDEELKNAINEVIKMSAEKDKRSNDVYNEI